MKDTPYHKLAGVLDRLPHGFPKTQSGIEIKILKKIFDPHEAELFCDLRLTLETAEQIAHRTNQPLEGLEKKLIAMSAKGQIHCSDRRGVKRFQMVPYALGIYEFQLNRMDAEFVKLSERYGPAYSRQVYRDEPSLMQVLTVEKSLPVEHRALHHELASAIVDRGVAFGVHDCICRKARRMINKGCGKPLSTCLSIALEPDQFYFSAGRRISKTDALAVLNKAEKSALVHLTYNVKQGHYFICNCCGCCCAVLRAINEANIIGAVNSYHYAVIDSQKCIACGTCREERCQVGAVQCGPEGYYIDRCKCIGCGLCESTCPAEAIRMEKKPASNRCEPPEDNQRWFEARAHNRGISYDAFK